MFLKVFFISSTNEAGQLMYSDKKSASQRFSHMQIINQGKEAIRHKPKVQEFSKRRRAWINFNIIIKFL